MSCIEKMTIQGIRSYGPKEKDTQIIEFFTPVTLIVGQNGCGKTTIIECLKYATTSDMPPNTKGSSFLFDPKLIDEVETKGKIKLYFRDTSGLTVQVQKNLCCTQKAKKLEFRTLETLISRYDSHGKLASTITSKCVNADAEVVNAFGVSKAVLEHVIFCHQEDSNWPLSDGKLLKTRFDEIFSATKYIKALDSLKKVRLEKNQLIKQMEIERKHLETYKNRSEQLRRDLEENTNRLESLVDKKKDLGEKLKPIKKQLEFYFQESARVFEIKIELDKIENEKGLIEKQIKELLTATKDCLFTGTDAELEEYVDQFKATTDKMRREKEKEIYDQIEATKQQIKQINSSKSKISLEMGALENRFKDYNENKKRLGEICTKACDLIGLESSNADDITSNISDLLKVHEDQIGSLQEKAKQQDTQFQSKIDLERDKRSKIEQSIQNKKESITKYQNQCSQIEEELCLIVDNKAQVELYAKIGQLEAEIEDQSLKLINVDEIKSEIKELDNSKFNLKQKETEIDAKINKWHLNSKLQTEINMLRNEKKNKQDQIRKIKIHIEEDMENFFIENDNFSAIKSNDSMLKGIFDSECKQLESQLASLESKRKDLDKNLSSNEFKRKMLSEDFRNKENQLRDHEDILLNLNDLITNESDIDRFDAILEKLQEEQKNLLDEKGFLSGVDKTYKRFAQQLQVDGEEKHSCPVCMRMFQNMDEINDTINELKKYTRKIPQKVEDLDEKLKLNEQKLEKMINAKSVKEYYATIKKKELPELKEKIDEYDKNVLPKLRKELTETDGQIRNLARRKSYAASLQSEIILIDRCNSEITDLEKKIDGLVKDGNLNETEDGDLESLSDQKMVLQAEIEQILKNIESDQEKVSAYYARNDQIHKLREQLNECKTRRNELESRYQKKSQLQDKQEELRTEIGNLKKEILTLEDNLGNCCFLVDDLIQQRETINKKAEKQLSERNNFYQEIKILFDQITNLVKCVKKFEQNDESHISELKKEFKSLDLNEKELNGRLDQLYQDGDDVKSEIARQEIKQRELNDNLMLRQKRKIYESKKEEYLKKKDQLELNDEINLKDFKLEQEKLEKKRHELVKETDEIVSKMNILQGRIQAINEELTLDTIKNAMEKYMTCTSDLKVLQYTVLDIEKYYKALDRAIMNYHQIKMNEINKIIKQLWRQVYRGIDIDYIEIRSEEENGQAEEQIKSRKTYNYRVVLIKGDTCLDMRGRCSAGQKVLASIIIRLALAETFCLNSGILALDEPTTNLDRENIESLASALVDIIKARSLQKNFQLIIITHDEDFVEMLGRSEYMDQFYRVNKDENGFSRISRRNNLNF